MKVIKQLVILFTVLLNLVSASAPPACLLACVAKTVKENTKITLNRQKKICSDLGTSIQKCFSAACPNDNAARATEYFKGLCGEQNISTSNTILSIGNNSTLANTTILYPQASLAPYSFHNASSGALNTTTTGANLLVNFNTVYYGWSNTTGTNVFHTTTSYSAANRTVRSYNLATATTNDNTATVAAEGTAVSIPTGPTSRNHGFAIDGTTVMPSVPATKSPGVAAISSGFSSSNGGVASEASFLALFLSMTFVVLY